MFGTLRLFSFLLLFLLATPRFYSQVCNVNCNGNFDDTYLTSSVGLISAIPCWSTMASDGLMEPWGTGFNGVSSYNGAQFIELNATQGATMYQTFNVTAGSPLNISFAHRGRAGVDSMEVLIGPLGGPYTSLGRYGDGTSAWGYYSSAFTPTTSGAYQLLFTPVYWSGGNIAIGNFLDAVSVSMPLSLGITATPTLICPGGASTLTASGASTYTWNTGATTSSTVVSPLVTTVYSVSSSGNGCLGSASITITVLPGPSLTITGPSSVCLGNSVQLTATGASTYSWYPGNSPGPTLIASPMATTIYTVSGASPSVGCAGLQTHTVVVFNNPVISVLASSTLCLGSSVTLIAVGASTYVWSPSGNTGNFISVNPSVNTVYTVTGTAVSGCTAVASSSVFVSSPVLTITSANISCAALGTATAQASGGFGPYSYSWTPSGQTSSVATNLNPDTYTINVTDNGSGCSTSSIVTFNSPVSFTGSIIHGSVSCFGANTATGSVSGLSGGSGNQNYTWTNGSLNYLSQNVNALSAGVWSVTVTDVLTACEVFSVITILQPLPLTASLSAGDGSVCVGNSLTMLAGGVGGSAPYTYAWQLGSTTHSQSLMANTSGSFTQAVTVTDANSCTSTGVLMINVIPLPTLLANDVEVCPGGTATLTASGATSYTWSNGMSASVFTLMPSGNAQYQVSGSALGCVSTTFVNVSLKQSPTAQIIDNGPMCAGESLVLSGTGGEQYFWKGPSGFQSALQSPTLQGVTANHSGIFTLTVNDKNNCRASTTKSITIYPLPSGYFDASQLSGCAPFCSGFSFVKNPASVFIDSMAWQVNGTLFTGRDFNYCFYNAGKYQVYGLLRDVKGCVNTMTIEVHVHPRPQADFDYSPRQVVEGLDVVNFSDQSVGQSLHQWNWYLINNDGPRYAGEFAAHTFTATGNYPVALVVSNVWGCKDTVVKSVSVEPDFSYYIPNAFTPNEDGKNEIFRPVGNGIKEMKLDVFDRWGELIFSTDMPGSGWDGTYKGQACQQDVYVWKLHIKSVNQPPKQIEKQLTGHVMLLR